MRKTIPATKPAVDTVDMINHPPHYTSHPSGVECIDIVEHMTFNIGSAIKYLWRAGLKIKPTDRTLGDAVLTEIEDLKKAAWFLNREIKRLEGEA